MLSSWLVQVKSRQKQSNSPSGRRSRLNSVSYQGHSALLFPGIPISILRDIRWVLFVQKKNTATHKHTNTYTQKQKQTKPNIADHHWDPQSELYHKQNPNYGPKTQWKPETAAIARSANPLKFCSESEIRAKILSGSAGPLPIHPPPVTFVRNIGVNRSDTSETRAKETPSASSPRLF